jgi:hypothetical protein
LYAFTIIVMGLFLLFQNVPLNVRCLRPLPVVPSDISLCAEPAPPAPADPGFTGVFVGVVVEFSADGDVRAEKGLECVEAAAGDGLGMLGLLGVCWVLLLGVGGRPDGGLSANTPACNGLC